jgi:hypothetical protein
MEPPGAGGRAELVRAAVMVGEVETYYRRAGSGPVVIVLRDLMAERLMELALRVRVIVPESTTIAALAPGPSGERPFTQWLSGFLEGLGVMETTIVAPVTLVPELRAIARTQPGVIRRVVLSGVPMDAALPSEIEVRWAASDADLAALVG